jgi:CHAT domain-containing protein/uncharacterized protein HemY
MLAQKAIVLAGLAFSLGLGAMGAITVLPGVAQTVAQATDPRKTEADRLLQQGIEQIESREPKNALQTLEQALQIYQAIKDRRGEGQSLVNLGRAYQYLKNYDKAIKYSKQSLSIARSIKDQQLEVEALKRLGLIYLRTRNHPKSISYVEQTLAIHRKNNNRVEEARSLGDLGFVYLQAGNFAKAVEVQERSVQLAIQLKDSSLIFEARGNLEETYSDLRGGAHSLLQQGVQQYQVNQFTSAIQSWEKALQIYRILQEKSREEDVLRLLGAAYSRIGNYPKAREYQENLLAISRKRGDASAIEEGPTRSELGYTELALANYSKAIAQMEQRLAIAQKNNDLIEQANALNNLGNLYSTLGSHAKAIENYEKSLGILRKDGDGIRVAATLSYIGNAYYDLGDYTKAISYYKQGLPTRQGPKLRGAHQLHGAMLSYLGGAYYKLGDYKTATNYYEQSLAIARSIDDPQREAGILGNLGNVYSALRNQAKAIEYREQSLAIYRIVKDRDGEGGALSGLGGIYEDFGNYSMAVDYYQKSLAVQQETRRREGEKFSLTNIGSVLEKQNQVELAIIFYKQAVNVSESIRQDTRSLPRDLQASYTESVADPYRRLAGLLLQQNRIIEAMQVLDLLKVQDLQDFLKDVKGNDRKAKGMELLTQEATILQTVNASPKSSLNDLLKDSMIQAQVQTLQRTAAEQNLKLNTYQDLQTSRQKLGKNVALFYPLILDDRLELVVLTKDRPPIRKPVAITQKQLETEIKDFRQQLQARSPLIKQPAQQLYQRLIQPIDAELKAAGVDTIVYAPDSIMRYVPLAALHDGNQWLAQRYQINYLTALALTPLDPDQNKTPRVLAAALTEKSQVTILGKTYDFPALQFTQPEVENLAKLLPNTTTLIDKTFNRPSLSTGITRSTILHLATHGMFVPDSPDQSIILLGDGTSISLREIEQQWKFPNVSLVVLSACETAIGGKLGSGIEILGFGYQMQRTGSRASISSLWTVDDGGTQGFMNTFYTVLKQGKTPAAAIQQTQQDFISGKVTLQDVQQLRASGGRYVEGGIPIDLTHPFYWAPFILIGNGL